MSDKSQVTCSQEDYQSTDVELSWQDSGYGLPEWQCGICLECGHGWNECARD